METLVWGYGLVEGPRADALGGLYFSDVLDGGVFYRRPDGEIEIVVPKRRAVGGIALHEGGGVVISGRDISHVCDGESRLLMERPAGALSLNDLFTDAQGRIITGSTRFNIFDTSSEQQPGEAYRIAGALATATPASSTSSAPTTPSTTVHTTASRSAGSSRRLLGAPRLLGAWRPGQRRLSSGTWRTAVRLAERSSSAGPRFRAA